jgi:hypothetical protein
LCGPNQLKIIPAAINRCWHSYQRIGTSGSGAGSTVSVSISNDVFGAVTVIYTFNGKEATASMTGAGLCNAINAFLN